MFHPELDYLFPCKPTEPPGKNTAEKEIVEMSLACGEKNLAALDRIGWRHHSMRGSNSKKKTLLSSKYNIHDKRIYHDNSQ